MRNQSNALFGQTRPAGRTCGVIGLLAIGLTIVGCTATPKGPPPIREIETTCIDPQVINYATFQSHNQKILSNRHGIFTAYVRTRNDAYTAQDWRLLRSTDGGQTFTTIFAETSATNPPVLETDNDGNVYLFRADYVDQNAYLYRFLARDKFSRPIVTVIPHAAAGKYAAAIDMPRRQLYFFAHNETFNVIDFEGKILRTTRLFQPGTDACLQYPHLSLDHDGTLHAAWTTVKNGVYLYWDIHHMFSPDGGTSWRNLDGKPILPPVVPDQHGPATLITRDDEFESFTWLSSFMSVGGKLHFVYLAQTKPPRMHYERYDFASGQRDIDLWPEFKGETLSILNLDGFFSTRNDIAGSPLFCTMQRDGHLVCLVSRDNGTTWHDYARGTQKFNPYAIGGARQITDDGYIIGTFTDFVPGTPQNTPGCKAYFFKIKAK